MQAPETAVNLGTLVLALGSAAFAVQMIGAQDQTPTIAGEEHLAIYARPSILAAQRKREQRVAASAKREVDYSPVGAIPTPQLGNFRLIEANETTALIREPGGAAVRVSIGDVVPGLGKIQSIIRQRNGWTIVATRGMITSAATGENSAAATEKQQTPR